MSIKIEDKEKIFAKIKEILLGAKGGLNEVVHAEKTLENVLQLNSDASLELQVAALAHDIDRGFEREKGPMRAQYPCDYLGYKAAHARRSAEIISKLLEESGGFEKSFIDRVCYLVTNHEVGGDQDADDLRDADSQSFMQDNLALYMLRKSKQETLDKLNWMFERMSEKNKKFAVVIYEDCLKRVKEYYDLINN